MNNVLYLSRGKCACGGHEYVSAVYLEQSITGEWHIMIEVQCTACSRLDCTDIPWSSVTDDPTMIQAARDAWQLGQDQESRRAEAEESGIPQHDNLGFLTGYAPPSDPSEV